MNKHIQTKFGPYPLIAILLCVVACTLRTVATFLGVDAFGYFEHSTLYKVSAWIIVSAVVILLTLPLTYRKRRDTLVEQTTPHTFLPSLMMGMLFLFFVGEGVFALTSEYFIPTLDKITFLLALALGLGACIYFFALAILESAINDRKANLGMTCVLFFGIYAAYLYLNVKTPRNAHIELSEEMTFIALMLYFLYEVRISLGKQKQNLYVTFALIGGILCSYCVIPTLIYYIASGCLLASSLTAFLLLCGTLAFITMRLALFEKSPTDAPIPLVEQLLTVAKAREEEVRETEALYTPSSVEAPEAIAEETDTILQECEVASDETTSTEEDSTAEDAQIVIEEMEIVGESEAVTEYEVTEESENLYEDEMVTADEPTVADEPVAVDEPISADEPIVVDEPIVADEPTVVDKPIAVDEPIVVDTEPSPEAIDTSESLPQEQAQTADSALPDEEPSAPQDTEEARPTAPSEHNEPKEEENEENISN